MNRLTLALAAVLAAGALAAVPAPVTGCAAAPPRGQSVDTAEESALIVWDDAAKVEHFVRRASFRSTGYDFGFLVPTPSRPELAVASDSVLDEVAKVTAPRVEYREEVREVQKDFAFGCEGKRETMMTAGKAEAPGLARGGVDVLEQKRVGDYDATVLAFRKGDGDTPERGAAELAEWLARHGYESPPAIEKWLERYVKDGWCVTAFKIAAPQPKKDGHDAQPEPPKAAAGHFNELRAKPIRMSFKAERPFYPYREPETEQTKQTGEPRLLRVFLAAPARYAGKLGDGSKPWPGQAVWAGPLEPALWTRVFEQAAERDPPEKDSRPAAGAVMPKADGYWLTEFEDRSSPRPGSDEVYFEPSADTSKVERPPQVVYHTRTVMVTPWWHAAVYIGLPVAIILGWLAAWRLLRRT
jgi:hypothetical protein